MTFHHEGTKSTKVSQTNYFELRVIRAFVGNKTFLSLAQDKHPRNDQARRRAVAQGHHFDAS